MSQPIVQVNGLTKAYRIGLKQKTHDDLVSAAWSLAKAPLRNFQRLRRLNTSRARGDEEQDDILWALKDVSFEVQEGEVLGIIGRNGAGKSTLLKILSRITEPTSGEAVIRGRVSSLLEVGTGFHPELTGRENVYLNGSILGMKKREIDRRFDEIVDFSGVEKFLDTPVKRYSSGMKVRLAFAVAAHLEPEVLIIDEVLAVGDAEFQKKCLGKMENVAESGRTVLFVSHNMAAVRQLCGLAAVLENGGVAFYGKVDSAISSYLSRHLEDGFSRITSDIPRAGSYRPVISRVELLNEHNQPLDALRAGHAVNNRLTYECNDTLRDVTFGIGIGTDIGERVSFLQTRFQHGRIRVISGRGTVTCRVPSLPLTAGRYTLSVGCSQMSKQIDRLENIIEFEIEAADFFGTGALPLQRQGPALVYATWTLGSKTQVPTC